jgi:DNA repair protein RadC
MPPTREPVAGIVSELSALDLAEPGFEHATVARLLESLLEPAAEGRVSHRARRLLAGTGGLRGLAHASVDEIRAAGDLTLSEARRVRVALDLGRRWAKERARAGAALRAAVDVHRRFGPSVRDLRREIFVSLLLDTKHRLLRAIPVSIGSLTASLVHPREVFAPAIRHSAAGLLVFHNHPSGDPTPSAEDLQVTRRLAEVGRLVGIPLLDHVILGDASFRSLSESIASSPGTGW